jgi:3-demethylubiquinone-9 3-methyltransferase
MCAYMTRWCWETSARQGLTSPDPFCLLLAAKSSLQREVQRCRFCASPIVVQSRTVRGARVNDYSLLEGGSAEQCGWLKDRFGLTWQIVPTVLGEMMAAPDRAKAKRATDAMLKMVKIDIAALQAAFAGTAKP